MSRILRHVPLTMRDGVRLDANVHLPGGHSAARSPVIVAANPYAKDVWFGPRTAPHLERFTRAGYAVAVVDFRGTGASEGVKQDAFERVEQDDIHDVVEELAAQEWCDGRAAVWGLSYGGITALRAAAGGPSSLRAVVAIEGSTDPYTDEVARRGAVGLAMIIGEWSAMMLALTALPPESPWLPRSAFSARLRAARPWHEAWAEHPHRDHYWRGREVDPAAIEVPTLLFTGWRDTNVAGAWRDFAAIGAPRRIVCGPWLHGMPEGQERAPVDSVALAIAWFDEHVRGIRPEGPPAPVVSAYVMGAERWEFAERYPAVPPVDHVLHLADGALRTGPPATPGRVSVRFDATVGVAAGLGMSAAPGDQARDAARSAVFTSEALGASLDLAGEPRVSLSLLVPHLDVDVAANLNDLAPDGRATLITRAFQRLSNPPPYTGTPRPADAGHRAELAFDPTRYRLRPGHRLQLTLSAAAFPEHWPHLSGSGYDVLVGPPHGSALHLPVIPTADETPPFELPEPAAVEGGDRMLDRVVPVTVEESPDGTEVVVRGGHRSAGRTLEGDPVELLHAYEISARAHDPSATRLSTRTDISAGTAGSLRSAHATCEISPYGSAATLRVTGDGIDHSATWDTPSRT
ncbi:CocE/NonD family hydrolase [Nonomuraea sp. NPDC003214]